MSAARRAGADKAAQNQVVIKQLLKLPGNKYCADCKKNAHPRWASWNLGIFICIRCSGIHRGMGTHISRVKSVDLDSWTDEQLQSVLRWGNSRANKYWEAKLASGHVPSESKIENFIRTKYESKRWVMDGGMPDPSTLADSDAEDTPLRVVQEKQKAEALTASPPAKKAPAPAPNLFDDEPLPPPTTTSPPPAPAQKPPAKPADSLLGLDFYGSSPSGSPRPAETVSQANAGGGSTRPDLNRSILSLYSSAPKQTTRTHQPTNSGSFGNFATSPTTQAPPNNSGMNDLAGAFGDLNFAAASPPPQPVAAPPKPSPFANLTAGMMKSGPTTSTYNGSNNAFSSFGSAAAKPSPPVSSSMGDLFDLGSTPSYQSKPVAQPQTSKPAGGFSFDNAWASSATSTNNAASSGFGWSSPATTTSKPPPKPTVADDDDFGAFSSGGFSNPTTTTASKTGGAVKYDDDLFKNVWG
ncbi:hypothetical protein ABW19_dt0204666 [Dactylella cylindrospora]|nr:hypothetical protein ABW19_dt0204666 [Dactylella cylindrospora]